MGQIIALKRKFEFDEPQMIKQRAQDIFALNIVGRSLTKWRNAQGISYSEIWERLNISAHEFRSWESGLVSPRCDRFYAVVTKLGSEAYLEAGLLLNGLSDLAQRSPETTTNEKLHRPNQDALGVANRIAV